MNDNHIYINKITIKINSANKDTAEKILRTYSLSADKIKSLLLQVEKEYPAAMDISEGKVIFELGDIAASHFDREFSQRLASKFADFLYRAQADIQAGISEEAIESRVKTPAQRLAELSHNDVELYELALACLQPATLQQLLKISPPAQLRHLLVKLWQHRQHASGFINRVTASRLSFAALAWLFHRPQGQRWLRVNQPAVSQLQNWPVAIAAGEIPADQLLPLLTGQGYSLCPDTVICPDTAIRNWLWPLWQHKSVRDAVRKHTDQQTEHSVSAQMKHFAPVSAAHTQPVVGAGIVLFWALLPQLFSVLDLLHEQQFVSEEARWQAVLALDWLSWATEKTVVERLQVNQLLCGLPLSEPVPDLPPLRPQQLQQTEEWFAAIGQQLPTLQKLSLNDIRQLFLQRAGEIDIETTPAQILIKPEPFDLLLNDWPWPLTVANFPWLQQPLILVWPINDLTG